MKNDNNMFQVLVANTLQAKGGNLSNLSDNELGVIDTNSGVTIDSTTAPSAKAIAFYLPPANSSNILKSVGKEIKLSRLNSITKKAYAEGVDAVATIVLPAIGNDEDAVIAEGVEVGVTFRISDSKVMTTVYGNEVRKFFFVTAKSSSTATATELAAIINNDKESVANGGFIEASVTGSEITVEFGKGSADESLTLVNKSVQAFGSQSEIEVSVNTENFAYAQGKGKYVQELERIAAGWNGATGLGAYRFRSTLPLYNEFLPEASANANYNLYIFNYDLDYPQNANKINNVETYIAIPSTADTVISNFEAILNALTTDAQYIGL